MSASRSSSARVTLLSKNFSRAVSANHEQERRLCLQHAHLDRHKVRARSAINTDVHNLQADLCRISNRTPALDEYLRQSAPPSSVVARRRSANARMRVKSSKPEAEEAASGDDESTAERFPYDMMDPQIENKVAAFLKKITPADDEVEDSKDKPQKSIQEKTDHNLLKNRGKHPAKEQLKAKPQSSMHSRRCPRQVVQPTDGTTDAALIAQSGNYMERLRRVLQRNTSSSSAYQDFASLDPVVENRMHNFKVIARKLQRVEERRARTAFGMCSLVPESEAPANTESRERDDVSSSESDSDSGSDEETTSASNFNLRF